MTTEQARLTPPKTKPNTSAARIADDWYAVCRSRDLRKKPIAFTLLGVPLAVFRDDAGGVGALLDRCPHRNVPLSLGRVNGGQLECGYHGWSFDREGTCQRVPGLCGEQTGKGRRVDAYPTRELDGYVWVYGTPGVTPEREPFRVPHQDDPRYTTVHQRFDMEGTVHAVLENALDVPHTAFLHRGLFRADKARQPIEVRVRRFGDRAEAEYIGEQRPDGVIGRLLSPSGGVVEHFDRFFLPSIGQVEYRLGEDAHVVANSLLTPITDHLTRMFGVVSFRLPFRVPARVLEPILKPLGVAILKQDATMLREQTDTIHRFGGEQYVSTDIDVLGPHILRLLRQAERGHRGADEPTAEKSLTMMV